MRLVCVRCSGCVEVGVWNFLGGERVGWGDRGGGGGGTGQLCWGGVRLVAVFARVLAFFVVLLGVFVVAVLCCEEVALWEAIVIDVV